MYPNKEGEKKEKRESKKEKKKEGKEKEKTRIAIYECYQHGAGASMGEPTEGAHAMRR